MKRTISIPRCGTLGVFRCAEPRVDSALPPLLPKKSRAVAAKAKIAGPAVASASQAYEKLSWLISSLGSIPKRATYPLLKRAGSVLRACIRVDLFHEQFKVRDWYSSGDNARIKILDGRQPSDNGSNFELRLHATWKIFQSRGAFPFKCRRCE